MACRVRRVRAKVMGSTQGFPIGGTRVRWTLLWWEIRVPHMDDAFMDSPYDYYDLGKLHMTSLHQELLGSSHCRDRICSFWGRRNQSMRQSYLFLIRRNAEKKHPWVLRPIPYIYWDTASLVLELNTWYAGIRIRIAFRFVDELIHGQDSLGARNHALHIYSSNSGLFNKHKLRSL